MPSDHSRLGAKIKTYYSEQLHSYNNTLLILALLRPRPKIVQVHRKVMLKNTECCYKHIMRWLNHYPQWLCLTFTAQHILSSSITNPSVPTQQYGNAFLRLCIPQYVLRKVAKNATLHYAKCDFAFCSTYFEKSQNPVLTLFRCAPSGDPSQMCITLEGDPVLTLFRCTPPRWHYSDVHHVRG